MKEIFIHHPYSQSQIPAEEVVLVLGYFDGVHIGHRAVIEKARAIAEEKGLKLALMTFNHHPSIVFNKLSFETMKPLATPVKKGEIMKELGVEIYYVVDFTSQFARLSPQEFVDQYIVGLHAVEVVTGFDYTFGKADVASVEHFPKYAKNRFNVTVVAEYVEDGEKVSSTLIRSLLDKGEIEQANHLLGRTYETTGIVVHGEARGRTLGFPTANIDISRDVRLPRVGVYVNRVKVNGKWYRGMASIGYNDTFGDNLSLTLEVYILDFDEDIYGEEITVEWIHYIRDMVKFNGIEELIAQLESDKRFTLEFDMKDEKLG
ncbi:riboflavin kinase / FMN adenylyltransferase [Pilibacter termitis]|uniref:Riboflavin biosynthesis protein n=1 Tax=Pilibacter termitis TaxID=263852 RepID=A0A1T4L9Y2_9ENTE|nr:riboflavin biosynthesis protein RibF [Pilibacter termitis]SJZ51378.1 riboflavin kinase / FMN adenylyltransferase [Pilibacter termitis]